MRRIALIAAGLMFVGLLASCGNDDSDPPAAPSGDTDTQAEAGDDATQSDTDEASPAPSGGSGAAGTVTINGTTYGMDESHQCALADLGIAGVERLLDTQYWGTSPDGRVQLDVYLSEFSGAPSQDVSWSGPEGVFGNSVTQLGDSWVDNGDQTYQDPPVSVDGTRATGSLVLYDALTMEDTIEIDFDATFPSSTVDC